MAFLTPTEIRSVREIAPDVEQLIRAFLQGSVYCWVKNRSEEPFALRDLMGGENFEWLGTPLYALYEKHIARGKESDDAVTDAAKDAGWLLKSVLSDDRRHFELGKAGLVSVYRWVGGEP